MDSSTMPGQGPRLLDSVREVMRVHHYSISTERSYIQWIRRLIYFHNKRYLEDMGVDEVKACLTHLALNRGVSASTQNQALSAILFLYRRVLEMERPWLDDVIQAKRSRRLPVGLTRREIKALLSHFDGTRWLLYSLIYGCGFWIIEGVRLRVKNICQKSIERI